MDQETMVFTCSVCFILASTAFACWWRLERRPIWSALAAAAFFVFLFASFVAYGVRE